MFSEKVHIVNHPLVSHKLTIMRDKNTSVKDFRELVSEIGMLITYEATRDLPLTTKHIETPICEMEAPTLAGRKFVVVPILRAGLGLVDGVLRLVPSARVGHIGMYRDEETLEPHPYFCKMPKDVAERDVLIVDPMLATGGSAAEAIAEMKKFGCKHIKLMVLVAAPEGIEYLQKLYPDVDIYAGAVDKCLNENGYIVPGLGDAGVFAAAGKVPQNTGEFRHFARLTVRLKCGILSTILNFHHEGAALCALSIWKIFRNP